MNVIVYNNVYQLQNIGRVRKMVIHTVLCIIHHEFMMSFSLRGCATRPNTKNNSVYSLHVVLPKAKDEGQCLILERRLILL